MAKKNYTWNLESEIVDKVKELAEKDHRSMANYIETMMIREVGIISLFYTGPGTKKIRS
jgi:hypothetical protein